MSQPHHAHRIKHEPVWHPVQRFTAGQLPQQIRYWLLDDGSLTSRLIAASAGQFAVQRLYQGWQVPLPSERRLLGLPARELALIREVALLGGSSEAVVYARSVFPLSCLTGSLGHLRGLQNKPLGAILFKHPGMHRSPFELSELAGDCDYLPTALRQKESAWGRRSRFNIAGKSLMVSEVFLRNFTPWSNMAPVHRTQRGKVSAANYAAKK
ncbi:MAG: chorismate lyase [Halioglobus sp.]